MKKSSKIIYEALMASQNNFRFTVGTVSGSTAIVPTPNGEGVKHTVDVATDGSGNTATCAFSVNQHFFNRHGVLESGKREVVRLSCLVCEPEKAEASVRCPLANKFSPNYYTTAFLQWTFGNWQLISETTDEVVFGIYAPTTPPRLAASITVINNSIPSEPWVDSEVCMKNFNVTNPQGWLRENPQHYLFSLMGVQEVVKAECTKALKEQYKKYMEGETPSIKIIIPDDVF